MSYTVGSLDASGNRDGDDEVVRLASAEAVGTVLEAVDDEDSRAILEAAGDPRTARELSTACDIPLSTVYRKLDLLLEASLVEDHVRVRESGHHASQYVRCFDELRVTIGENEGIGVEIPRADRTAADDVRHAGIRVRNGA